jgi:hypothetical protein
MKVRLPAETGAVVLKALEVALPARMAAISRHRSSTGSRRGGRRSSDTSRTAGAQITHTTAETGWRGERMNYGLAVESLLQRWQRGKSDSAETRRIDLT